MYFKKALVASILLAVAPVSQVMAQSNASTNVSTMPASSLPAAPVAAESGDCSHGFLSRFAAAWKSSPQLFSFEREPEAGFPDIVAVWDMLCFKVRF